MEHKQEKTDPVAKSPASSGDVAQKPATAEVAKGPALGDGGVRSAEVSPSPKKDFDLDEPDDGLPEPAHPVRNKLREYRIENMMSKAELARKAGLSVLTVARIEKGYDCRMDTKRKLLKALGLKLADRRKVFEDE
jgi:DNA-binding XRE family transcriptional regulator